MILMYSWYPNLAIIITLDPYSNELSFKFYVEIVIEIFQTPSE